VACRDYQFIAEDCMHRRPPSPHFHVINFAVSTMHEAGPTAPDVRELAGSRVGVVMGVGLTQVFGLGLDVGLVIVFQGRVIVLVGMGGRHVLPLAAMP
jgi:hypothetical protein